MRQRMAAFGSVGVAALLGFLLLWGGLVEKPASAMEKMAESIRKAKSYKCLQIVQLTDDYPDPGAPSVTEGRYTVYWLASGSARTEIVHPGQGWKGPGPEYTQIFPAGKPSIHIDHRTKKFYRYPVPKRAPYSSVFDDLENLSKFSAEPARELGTKQINGKIARGFQIDMKKMDAENPEPGRAEIWIDLQSNLPVFVRYEGMKGLGCSNIQEDRDIQWNIDLDPRLFDPTPPKGYTDATPKPPTLEEQVRQIARSLRIYAQASGGRYPQNRVNSLDTIQDLCRILGVVKWPGGEEKGNAGKAAEAIDGFDRMGDLLHYDFDAAYHGKTVTPRDKDKVVFRWKLDDGRYEVIFGDLRSETVTAERLRKLEGK